MYSIPYIADLVDGEGCIRFNKQNNRLYPALFITNTNLEVLEGVKNKFGGDIHKAKRIKENWKPAYHWRISYTKAALLLEKLYPYLVIKKNQANLVLCWLAIREVTGEPVFAADELGQFFIEQTRWLNKKGVHNDPEPVQQILQECGDLNAQ